MVPVSCKLVKTVAIPFSYSLYLSDGSFGLGFTWDATGHEDFVVEGGYCGLWLTKIFGVGGRKGNFSSFFFSVYNTSEIFG